MRNPEFGAGIWMFQQFVDRYATDAYGPPVSTLEAIERAAAVGDIKVLDINYPFAGDAITVEQVRETLQRTGLRAQAITPHLYMREFQMGSFTNPDAAVRRKAVDLSKQAIEVASALDATYVKFWPGQDGYDYPFQVDYVQVWDYEVSGVRAVAESAPEMQLAIEYKLKEPRVHMLFSADVLQLVSRRGKLVSVEVNDNWREWDDDMAVGSVHLIETLEFLHGLRQIDWQGPILLDQFPFREDPIVAARSSIQTIRSLNSALDRLDLSALTAAQERQDALAAQGIVLNLLLGTSSGKGNW
jgi:xylose isomerase